MTRPVEASQRMALGLVRLSGVPASIADIRASLDITCDLLS